MKSFVKLFFAGIISFVIISCHDTGELVGVMPEKYIPMKKLPKKITKHYYDMVYVPSGSFNKGYLSFLGEGEYAYFGKSPYNGLYKSENDSLLNSYVGGWTTTIQSFYMSAHEVTNYEYKVFFNWVRDSIARTILGENDPSYFINQEEGWVNWEKPIDWNNDYLKEKLFIKPEFELVDSSEENNWAINSEMIQYKYSRIVIKENRTTNFQKNDVFIEEVKTNIYPDTLLWVKEFPYAFNDPLAQLYFWHPAYDEYPVVGVTWHQANAYCAWRNHLLNKALEKYPEYAIHVGPFRLPSSAEWEYAATPYDMKENRIKEKKMDVYFEKNRPGLPFIGSKNGFAYNANYGPIKDLNGLVLKNYVDDGCFYTCQVQSYKPNDYGIYDMAGNVAEWTYSVTNYGFEKRFVEDLNTYDPPMESPKGGYDREVRGGSWADPPIYLIPQTSTYYHEDEASCRIGFRIVSTYYPYATPPDYDLK
jgi:sulfatase modifying factor 1